MNATDETADDPLHRAYFRTRFRWAGGDTSGWPAEFAIISAYATTGEQWSDEENEAGHESLYLELERRNVWVEPLTGYAPDTGHAEPGCAVELRLEEAKALGRRFRQDAIFHVRGNELFVVQCAESGRSEFVGAFRERLDLG